MVTLLLTSTLLVAGGLGIYIWKSSDDDDKDTLEDTNDDYKNDENDYDYNDDYENEYIEEKPVQKKGGKTRRSRKRHTGTKRRYSY